MSAALITVSPHELEARILSALRTAGASDPSAQATTKALMHASLTGIDSHGARLTPHYARMLRTGRINPTPALSHKQTAASSAMLDADDGLGHYAAYEGMKLAVTLATETGIGAVGIHHSTHLGAAGAFALAAADAGMIGIVLSNSDANVAVHGGRVPFHGTNPIACAAPVAQGRPWLLDMATSSIPFNRVRLYRSLDRELPPDVAADQNGHPTQNPHDTHMLLPLGGESYGFKGSGLAGLVTLFSALLTGAVQDADMVQMTNTTDFTTRRNVGHFVIALDPARFIGKSAFEATMTHYLTALRAVPPTDAAHPVQAPGDREWATQAFRQDNGIPLDPDTAEFLGFS